MITKKNKISLTGMMGSGKSSIGKILAKKFGLPFYDSDKEVEKKKLGWNGFAKSIMTTDTFPKGVYKKTRKGNKEVKLIGIAKGSGMIAPNMATMLGYIFTDADFSPKILKELLVEINEKSFNSITVDSDMSTNDMVCFFSTRKKNNL